MSKSDQFADLFASVAKRKDNSKLTLAERQKLGLQTSSKSNLQQLNNNSNQWDFLDRPSSNASSIVSISKPSTPQLSNDLLAEFDVLDSTSKPANTSSGTTNQNRKPLEKQPPVASEHLFEGFAASPSPEHQNPTKSYEADLFDSFDLPRSTSSTPFSQQQAQQTTCAEVSSKDNFDDLFSVFDALPKPQHSNESISEQEARPSLPSRSNSRKSHEPNAKPSENPGINDDAFDEAVASLIDMGFPIDQATDALNHTKSGHDVQAAISYIMGAAHNKARAKAGLPPQRTDSSALKNRKAQTPEDYIQGVSKIVSGFSNRLVNEVQNRFLSPSPNDGKPAWMRDQHRYRPKDSELDVEPEEINSEALRKLHLERKPTPPPPRRSQVAKPQRKSEPEADLLGPEPTKPQQQQEQEVDLFSPVPTTSKIDLFSDDQMTSSSRRRPFPETAFEGSSLNVNRPNVYISGTQMELFRDSREQGNTSFKNGDFTNALLHYQTALSSLPEGHVLQILIYSNLITCYSKTGENKQILDVSSKALNLIGEGRGDNEEVEGKKMIIFWRKIMQKKAEALEHSEKFEEAALCYQELIENGGITKSAMDGRRRCQDVLNPKPKTKLVSSTDSMPSRPKPKSKSQIQGTESSEALNRMRETQREEALVEEEKFKLHDAVELKINTWKQDKEDNLRALLSSLHLILWPESDWKQVGLSDLVLPKKVKIVYMKAVAKVHPDKVPKNATNEQKMIAQGVFVVINRAWETFKQQNGLN